MGLKNVLPAIRKYVLIIVSITAIYFLDPITEVKADVCYDLSCSFPSFECNSTSECKDYCHEGETPKCNFYTACCYSMVWCTRDIRYCCGWEGDYCYLYCWKTVTGLNCEEIGSARGSRCACTRPDPGCYGGWNEWECNPIDCCQTRTCKWPPSYWQIGSCAGGTCGGSCPGGGGPVPTQPPSSPSCWVGLAPTTATIAGGAQLILSAGVIPSNGTVSSIKFSSGNSAVVSVSPASDSTSPYKTTATGASFGSTTVTASVVMSGSTRCSAQSVVTVTPPGPWWQVRDADISSSGSLVSFIPPSCSLPACRPVFGLDGSGGFPGVPLYSVILMLSLGTAENVSSTGWSANTSLSSARIFGYDYFFRQIPTDLEITTITMNSIEGSYFASGGTLSHGAYWYKYDGSSSSLDLTIASDANVGSRKVILFVDNADLLINGKINLTDGIGFFMAIVGKTEDGTKGNILISQSVGGAADGIPELEGLFLADGQIKTGQGNIQLHVRGALSSFGGIALERDLDDDTKTPAEYIEYAPDQVLVMPSVLKVKKFSWKEVAP